MQDRTERLSMVLDAIGDRRHGAGELAVSIDRRPLPTPDRQLTQRTGAPLRYARHEVACVRSIVMPPSPVITAVPVKGIVYPTSLRTVWRPPKRVSPYSADHAADDRPWRPRDEEARSRAKRRTNGMSSRMGERSCHENDEC